MEALAKIGIKEIKRLEDNLSLEWKHRNDGVEINFPVDLKSSLDGYVFRGKSLNIKTFSLITYCTLLITLSASAKTLHVSPDGSSSGNGEVDNPLNSIQVAINRAAQSGDTIEISSGTYKEVIKISNKRDILIKKKGNGIVKIMK